MTGFIPVDQVTGATDSPSADETAAPSDDPATEDENAESVAPLIPWQEPVDTGVVVDNDNEPLPVDGLACRVDPSADAEVTVRLSPGESVEVTGEETWLEGIAFLPVNCAGAGGFVRADYVQLASEAAVEEEPEEAVTEETATEQVATDEVVTEEPITEEAVTEEAAIDEFATEEAATEEAVTDEEEPPTEEPATEAVVTEETATEEAATEEAVTEEMATEETATEAVVTEEAVPEDEATGTPAEKRTTANTPRAATEEPATSVTATDVAVTEEVATRAPATEDVAVERAASATVAATAPAQPNQQVATAQQAQSRVDLAQTIGTAEVVSTNGEGVRCRTSASSDSSTFTVLAEGTTVQILSVERNGFLGVICGGQAGFANVDFLYSGGAGDEIAANAGSVTVVGTGGGLNCRSGPGLSNGVLTILRDGTTLSIRGASSNGWAPVVCGGQNGYVSIDYVEAAGSASSGSGTGGDVSAAAATMIVRGTNGDGVRCRTGASTSSSIITVLSEGTRVSARGGAMGGWVPVTCAGRSGYVSATYLGASGGTSSGPTSGGSGTGVSSGWTWVTVTGTGGGGLRCRSSASTSGTVLMIVGEGRGMALRGTASNGWQPVNCGGRSGFVSTQYITGRSGSGSAPAPRPTPTPAPPTSSWAMASGDHAKVTDRLNLRYSPSLGAGISTTIPAGTIVQITGRATSGFYPVNWDGLKGYVSQDYIYKTSAALSKRGGSGSPSAPTAPPSGDAGSNATGNSMVSFALRYEGYPYIWASHGPSGFDCSGFTYWVTKNVTGKDIGYGLWTQVSAGIPVSRANLQPGDLVFFQNTYKAGLSHSGVYIGNNRFIHAENETTGVRISDLNSTYYGSRWYGAVRMT